MEKILRLFTESSLYDACLQMLGHLQVAVNEVTREPIPFADLYQGTYSATLPMALQEALSKVEATYYIGNIDEATLTGKGVGKSVDEVKADTEAGKYEGMMVFAIDVAEGKTLSRQESTTLTRGFNRIASAQPVILFIRQDKYLSLATCERMSYTQEWRNGNSEKLGKVSILRNINCEHPHRGHLDILEALGDKAYPTFEALYKHWMEVFSNELLTKKFYSELSDWYAWAVQVARFPNDITTDKDDEKFNHEACIRLITRLIFVWFLKQKHLIPNEFFDEDYIREHFIENFDPHDRKSLYYDTEKSKYYRLILQNLFFAMLNRPIVAEGKDKAGNRRFRTKVTGYRMNAEYNVNNLMRYEGDFMPGGAAEFLHLANCSVPFLNGGLFECLDDKPNKIYYDGFSENEKSLEQLYLPDYLFFGDEVGHGIDLSKWYGDKKKKNVSAQGIIDILRHYCFTVEENTPYDQEVSLDPELLGKAFENLLAAYNPETQTSARKQTGSFYTPREIVQYMVNESLVAHLKRVCGDKDEALYRQLLSYSSEDIDVTDEQSGIIMNALYYCRVLDPACGSGAFPMGILQQMVHVLKRIDPTNEKWKDFMINRAIEQSKKAFMVDSETERKERLADIENAFNRSVNDPDYARKLYLIEHCIYGVDIQPIATQISKLRFFISLVVDQRPTADATHNFGIRPLPNLEAKFVSANTLIPVEYDSSLVDSAPEVIKYKEKLKELNHKIFLARRNIDKQKLKKQIKETRKALAEAIEDTGFVSHGAAQQLADWDMFDQNTSSPFFDPEWMFGVKGGFDIVIANPPYISAPAQIADSKLAIQRKKLVECKKYQTLCQKWDLYVPFMEYGICVLCKGGSFSMIVPFPLSNQLYAQKFRKWVVEVCNVYEIADLNGTKVFDNATVSNLILFASRSGKTKDTIISHIDELKNIKPSFVQPIDKMVQDESKVVWNFSENKRKSNKHSTLNVLGDFCYISVGMVLNADEKKAKGEFTKEDLISETKDNVHPREYIEAKDIEKYNVKRVRYLEYNTKRCPDKLRRPTFRELYEKDKIVMNCLGTINCTLDNEVHYLHNHSIYCAILWKDLHGVENKSISASVKRYSTKGRTEMETLSKTVSLEFLLAILNSRYADILLANLRGDDYHIYPEHIRNIPIPKASGEQQEVIAELVRQVIIGIQLNNDVSELKSKIDFLVYHLYGLTYDEVLVVDPETPITRKEYEAYK